MVFILLSLRGLQAGINFFGDSCSTKDKVGISQESGARNMRSQLSQPELLKCSRKAPHNDHPVKGLGTGGG